MRRHHFAAIIVLVSLVAGIVLSGGSHPRLASAADHPIPEPLKKAPPSKFECRFVETPVTIDGTADEAAWKLAETIDAFHLPWLGDKARMSRTSTTAKLLWDREYLYFFAEMEDGDLFADVEEHDGDLWKNDVFELFFRPDAEKSGYYEFQVSAAGTKFDAFYPKYHLDTIGPDSKKGKFNIDAKVKLRGTLNKRDDVDKGWSVEGRIPWTDFSRTGGRPVIGEAWKMNLCRFDYHKEWKSEEYSCVAPIAKRKIPPFFHQTEDYATITFVGPDAKTYALDKREPLTTSTVVGFPDPPPAFKAVRAISDYRPEFPIQVARIPGSSEALLITQPWSYAHTAVSLFPLKVDAKPADAVKLFDTPNSGTAYDIAFHPKFAENGYVYIGWNGKTEETKEAKEQKDKPKKSKRSYITRYTMPTKPPFTIDTKTAKTIIEWESDGHNGCAICFDTDGLMYVTSGDGTSDSDTNVTGQRTDLLLAKILRIDVDHPEPGEPGGVSPRRNYSIPKDNPYVGDKRFVPETWAYGTRNPWRITFDAKTKQLWLGQNGQDLWEYAHLVQKGDNFGWSVTEGSHPFYPERKLGPTPVVKPTVEHHHSEARSLTGGIVYHGDKLPELKGAYIYGDYSTGHIWAVKHDGKAIVWHKKIAITTLKITAFALDKDGELLILHHSGKDDGGFFTLTPNLEKAANDFPKKLSESGLFESVKDHKVKASVLPYSVNASFWSDGMHKERFLALPAGGGIGMTGNRGWNFPDKTVLVKSFALDTKEGDPTSRKWIETRFMTKQAGEWYGYSYLWNDAGTDATLIDAKGMDKEFTIATATGERKQVWHYPSRAECMVCHSRAQNYVLGLCELQMNKEHAYPSGRSDNQIRELEHLGMFKVDWLADVRGKLAEDAKPLPDQRGPKPTTMLTRSITEMKALVDPHDKKQPVEARARSWLHANCSSCHVEAGGGNALMELEFVTKLDKMRVVDVKPVHTTFDLKDAKLLVPGAPERSVLVHRIGLRGVSGQMPPMSSNRVDEAGLALMREWVKSLEK
ncbi:MAG: hypothetical protein C0467_23025 [Planctomycetaceae bacterium]|nr:hypothetical protein [Planctomycetaceae bacterium]